MSGRRRRPGAGPASRRGRPVAGFSLVETLIALAVLAGTMLFALAMVTREPLLRHRLDARRVTLDALEDWLEAVRGGAPLVASETRGAMTLAAEAVAVDPPGLCRLTLTAVDREVEPPVTVHLETLVYRPSGDCS